MSYLNIIVLNYLLTVNLVACHTGDPQKRTLQRPVCPIIFEYQHCQDELWVKTLSSQPEIIYAKGVILELTPGSN